MNIFNATRKACEPGIFIRKKGRKEEYTLYVAAGNVFRFANTGEETELDARDVLGNDWYLVDTDGKEIGAKPIKQNPSGGEG